jgi:predicted nucleotidyltransferase
MQDLARTSLTLVERRAVERFVELLQADYGAGLRSVWLYGSRARGEPRRVESDVDLLVVADRAGWEDFHRVGRLLDESGRERGANPVFF